MILSTLWFIVSAFRGIISSQRITALQHAKIAGIVALFSFIATGAVEVVKSSRSSQASAPTITPKPGTVQTTAAQTPAKPAGGVANSCDHGNPISGRFFVTSSNVNFRKGPGTEYDRVVNARATQVLGSTEYRTLDPAMVLKGLCATDGWLQAKIVEADGKPVDWESGWVARQFVTNSPSAEMTAGLIWGVEGYDDLTADEKAILRRGALKALRDEPKCGKVIHGHRDTFKKGGFYITCVSSVDAQNFNVFFSRQDLDAGAKIGIPEPFDETASRRGCEKAIKDRVSHPSTLDIHQFTGYATTVHDNGNRTIIQDFTAANGFGLQVEHRARCLIDPSGELEINIVEK